MKADTVIKLANRVVKYTKDMTVIIDKKYFINDESYSAFKIKELFDLNGYIRYAEFNVTKFAQEQKEFLVRYALLNSNCMRIGRYDA